MGEIPDLQGKTRQVGPLANVLCMYASGHEPTKRYATKMLDTISALAGTKVGIGALHSTIGRIGARSIRCAVLYDTLKAQWQALIENIGKGDFKTFNQPIFPKGEQRDLDFMRPPEGFFPTG